MEDADRGMWTWLAVLAVVVLGAAVWWTTSDSALVARGGEELDLMYDYSSLEELAVETTDVAVVEPTGETWTEHVSEAPFVVTELRVVSSDDGPLVADDLITIRQDDGRYVNAAPVPRAGERYVIFLDRSENDPGGTRYGIVGAQAVWHLDGARGKLTTPKSSLPRRVTVSGSEGGLRVSSR
ncbi:hypothetical protein [Oerskovia enterophila]|uniref:SAF domain-containing protein n=1 Tax=Oerskovia enterophila TaxID=43678 RepID=A0ABX2XZU9_9CELL|nr:hypothetical protein [Oerskovia enterophila]OCI29839.1 hypothetical protein OERS_34420 [Oerskovia enterophila]